jgi:hypothetical protein
MAPKRRRSIVDFLIKIGYRTHEEVKVLVSRNNKKAVIIK